jgi:hypothetical protein
MQTWDITPTKVEQVPLFQQINTIKNDQTELTVYKSRNEKEIKTPVEDKKDIKAQTPIIKINEPTKKENVFVNNSSKLLGEIEV